MFSYLRRIAGYSADRAAFLAAFCVAVCVGMTLAAAAQAAITLPSTGVALATDYATILAGITGVIAVAVGGMFAFKLLRKGIKWVSRAIG